MILNSSASFAISSLESWVFALSIQKRTPFSSYFSLRAGTSESAESHGGALLIEVIFSLDGIGLLGYEAVIKRDYPILFGTMFSFSLIGLFMQIVGDMIYVLIDPRIDFEARD